MPETKNSRVAQADADPMFIERWSPRALSPEPLSEKEIMALFEAARWAPSAYNDQPWLFRYAATEAELKQFRNILMERNLLWAGKAPFLAFLFARRKFNHNGQPNNWAVFDTGAAWMSLALQARKMGLYAHAMAGIKKEEAYRILDVSEEDYEAVIGIAVGRYGDPQGL